MSKKLTQLNEDDLKTKSQATYFFDCDGKGLNPDGTINQKSSKGSFCCILKKGTEYFILTAGHNLGNGTVEKTSTIEGSKYKLIKYANNFVELELIKDYRNTYDAALLKITKCNGVDSKDFNIKLSDGKLKIEALDFYEKTIKFNNLFEEIDDKSSETKLDNKDSLTIGFPLPKIVTSKFEFSNTQSNNLYYYKLDEKIIYGFSGGCVFKYPEKILGGIHKGTNDGYSSFTPFSILKLVNYQIV